MKPDQAAIALRNGQRLDVDLDIAEHAIALTIPYLFRIIDPTQTIGSSGHSKFRQLCDNAGLPGNHPRSEEHTSELQSLMRISYAVFCLTKKNNYRTTISNKKLNKKQR